MGSMCEGCSRVRELHTVELIFRSVRNICGLTNADKTFKTNTFLEVMDGSIKSFFKKQHGCSTIHLRAKKCSTKIFYQSTVVKIWNKLRWTQPVCLWVLQRSQTTVETVWQQPACFWTKNNCSMDSLAIIQDISAFNACAALG